MMDAANLVRSINANLLLLESSFLDARKAMGVRPNLSQAKQAVLHATKAFFELRELILQAELNSVLQPPDVINRILLRGAALADLNHEIYACEAVLASRSTRPVTGPAAFN